MLDLTAWFNYDWKSPKSDILPSKHFKKSRVVRYTKCLLPSGLDQAWASEPGDREISPAFQPD